MYSFTVSYTVAFSSCTMWLILLTATNLAYSATKIPFMYSFSGNCAASVLIAIHSCVCERFIYSQNRSTYFLQQNRQTDSDNKLYINRSQTHECGNWDCSRPIPFLRISNFEFLVFVLCSVPNVEPLGCIVFMQKFL